MRNNNLDNSSRQFKKDDSTKKTQFFKRNN